MKRSRPLTRELEQCLRILMAMMAGIEAVLARCLAQHQMGSLHHDAAEAGLCCQTLSARLGGWLDETSEDCCDDRLAGLLSAASQLDRLAGSFSRHPGEPGDDPMVPRSQERRSLPCPHRA